MGAVLQSSLKISFRLGGDFMDGVGVIGGDRNSPEEIGDEDKNNDELDDEEGLLSTFLREFIEESGIVSFDK